MPSTSRLSVTPHTTAVYGKPIVVLFVHVCCHSNDVQARNAHTPSNAELEGTLYHSLKLHLGACCSVGMWRQTDKTDGQTQRR